MRILLVDDSAALRTVFERIVRTLGHEVAAVATPDEGLARAADDFAAVVVDGRLSDCLLPEYFASLHAVAPRTTLFVIAALDERPLVARMVAAGVSAAIVRPFRASQIAAALEAVPRAGDEPFPMRREDASP